MANATQRFDDKIKKIYKGECFPLIRRFLEVNIFHIVFESLITIYTLEFIATFTNTFITKPLDIPFVLFFVLMPLVTVAIAVILYIAIWIYYVVDKMNYYMGYNDSNDGIDLHNKIANEYKKDVTRAQLLGVFLYGATAFVIAYFLAYHYSYAFENNQSKFISYMTILSCIYGALWNVSGIFRNRRVIWSNAISKLRNDNASKSEDLSNNLKCYKVNVVIDFFSVVFVVVCYIFVMLDLNDNIKTQISELINSYSFLIVGFVSMYVYYLKRKFQLTYYTSSETNVYDNIIYPTIEDVLKLDK